MPSEAASPRPEPTPRPAARGAAPRGMEDGAAILRARLGARALVLVGMMGAGKSTVGRRLAARLGLPFSDADAEIELSAGMTIPEIFASRGEAEFREGERRVIARLLGSAPLVLATGGGAFLDPRTREAVAAAGVSVWLRAEPEVLLRRVRRRGDRPLLKVPDPEAELRRLLSLREPIYALADLAVPSREGPHEAVVDDVLARLGAHLGGPCAAPGRAP